MSMMDMTDPVRNDSKIELGWKAQNLSDWLEKSTSAEWDEMKIIRTRLERLEKEKKSLMQSQSFAEGQNDTMGKSFKIRSVHKNWSLKIV